MKNEPILDEDGVTLAPADVADVLATLLKGLGEYDAESRQELLDQIGVFDEDIPVREARTYREVEMLTLDDGVVFSLQDGSKFTLTIQRYGGWAVD